MKTRDRSQLPIEQLAQLLLERAREDAALPRRPPANDDGTLGGMAGDTPYALAALPELRRETETLRFEPHRALPLVSAAEVASNEDLEELVSIALTSAQDAEDISREANAASRIAKHGMLIAVGMATLGMAIAIGDTVSARLYRADASQMAKIANQVQALGELQRHIDSQLEELHAAAAVQEASAAPVAPGHQGSSAAPSLAPLKATAVRELPAEAAAPQPVATTSDRPTGAEPSAPAHTTVASATAYPLAPPRPPPAVTDARYHSPNRTWAPYHPRPLHHYRTAVLPRPVVYLISSLRRDVRALFR